MDSGDRGERGDRDRPDRPDRSGDRRARILRAAAELFIANGFAGVSMDDVLAAVGGSKSTLYRYFADKTDLFRSAVELLIDERNRPLQSIRPHSDDVAGTLEDFGRHFAGIVLEPEAIALHRLVASEAERVAGLGQTFFSHGPAVGHAVLGEYLRTLHEQGVIEVDDPVHAAAQLYQAMLGSLQMRLLVNADDRPTKKEIDASISSAVDMFLNGRLRANPQRAPRAKA